MARWSDVDLPDAGQCHFSVEDVVVFSTSISSVSEFSWDDLAPDSDTCIVYCWQNGVSTFNTQCMGHERGLPLLSSSYSFWVSAKVTYDDLFKIQN